MKKYNWLIVLLITALLITAQTLYRELWFDEALTLLNFVLPLELGDIYFSYHIPNNHIVYSMLLKIWDFLYCGIIDIVVFWRLLSVLCALGMLWVIVDLRKATDQKNYFPVALVLSCLCVSAVFVNYATAIRGYALSWLLVALALRGLYDIFCGRACRGWWLYSISALLAVGTVPTNLLALGAAVIYAIPWMPEKFWCDKRFYCVAAILPLALICFYVPIAGAFFNTFKLGEGFSGRGAALMCTGGMYAASFGLLLIFGLFTLSKQPWQYYLRWSIWFFPVIAVLILHRAPFPRVFVTVLPVLAMLVIDGVKKLTANNWNNFHRSMFFLTVICAQLLLIPGGYQAAAKAGLSQYEDDFFRPWYMYPNYKISNTAGKVAELVNGGKTVFLSFSADPLPILFYVLSQGGSNPGSIRSDVPFNSVKSLPYGAIAVLRRDEDPQLYAKRFNGSLQKLSGNALHSFYLLTTP